MAKPPGYDPAAIAALRAARANLYQAQADRRRVMLLTRAWTPPTERKASKVQEARADLNSARAAAKASYTEAVALPAAEGE